MTPLAQHALDMLPDAVPRVPPLDPAREECVIRGLRVTDVRGDSQAHGFFIEAFGRYRSPDAAAVLLAGVCRDGVGAIRRAAGEQLADALAEAMYERNIELGTPSRLAFTALRARIRVTQAFGLGSAFSSTSRP